MVLCFIALGVFSVMGIFSAKYRSYAKEAFNCVIRKATLRKCNTDFDIKIKSEIVGSLMGVNKSLAGITNRHFELISWLFVILTVTSFAYSAYSVYNYVQYGNCNGPESTETCFFDPTATGQHGFSRAGEVTELKYPPSLAGHVIVNGSSKLTIIEYGCYSCPYTKKSEDAVNMLLTNYKDNITFIFKPMPVDRHPYANEAANAAECASEQGKYTEYKSALFQNQHDFRTNGASSLKKLGIGIVKNQSQFEACIDSNKYQDTIAQFRDEGKAIGIFGTPTFFIGNRSFVGHVDYEVMKSVVEEELIK